MCIQDIRIARKAVPSQFKSFTVTAVAARLLMADANRYSVTAGMDINTALAGVAGVVIAAKIEGAYVPLMGISNDHPQDHATLLEFGQLIQGEIWCWPYDATILPAIIIADTSFLTDLSDV